MTPIASSPVALITGAAQGIGRLLAIHLAQEGYAIAALDRQEEGLRSLKDQLFLQGKRCACVVGDVTRADQLAGNIKELEHQLGPIDLLIANAGVGRETSALDYRADVFNLVWSVNLVGVSNSIAAVLPGMIQRRRGHLVAISSVASLHGLPRMIAYSVSKAAVNTLMEGIRAEVRPLGIHVTTICPGWIRTAMTQSVQDSLPDILELEEGVRQILYAIRKKLPFYAFPRSVARKLRFLSWLPISWQDAYLGRMSQKIRPKGAEGP